MSNAERRSGRTTIQVDKAIQSFFANGYAIVSDHSGTRNGHLEMLGRVNNRLQEEHPHLFLGISSEEPEVMKICRVSGQNTIVNVGFIVIDRNKFDSEDYVDDVKKVLGPMYCICSNLPGGIF